MDLLTILLIVGGIAVFFLCAAIALVIYVFLREYFKFKLNHVEAPQSSTIANKSSGYSSATITQMPTSLDTQ